MVGADEARVAVLLEEQPVNVVGGVVEGVTRTASEALRHAIGRRAVDVDLARRTGLQELPAKFTSAELFVVCSTSLGNFGNQIKS